MAKKERFGRLQECQRSLEFNFKRPSDESFVRFLAEGGLFNPDFGIELTPSSTEALAISVEHLKSKHGDLRDRFVHVKNYWLARNRMKMSTLKEAGNVAFALFSREDLTIEELEEHTRSPPRNLKKMQRTCFRDYVNAYLKYNADQRYLLLALNSTPCFLEPEDLKRDFDVFLRPESYTPSPGYPGEFRSKDIALLNTGKRTAERRYFHPKINVLSNGRVDLKVVIVNRDDKLDSVVELTDEGMALGHYDVKFHTEREWDIHEFHKLEFQFKKKGENRYDVDILSPTQEEHLVYDRYRMVSEPMFGFFSENPLFLGGNAYLSLLEYVWVNKQEIIGAARHSASRLPATGLGSSGLESVEVVK